MGSSKKVVDNQGLLGIALDYGMTPHELMDEATFPLSKIAKAIGDRHEKSERKKISQEFLDACQNAGIVESSDTRFTLR
jgi:hypothetical protein